jgi:hypothetical protein
LRFIQKSMFGSPRCLAMFSGVMRNGKAWIWNCLCPPLKASRASAKISPASSSLIE